MARRRIRRPARPLGSLSKKELLSMVKQGMSDADIGKKFGVSRQAVAQKRWSLNIPSRIAKNDVRNERIIKAYQKGMSGSKISEKFNLSVSQTYRIINQELGV